MIWILPVSQSDKDLFINRMPLLLRFGGFQEDSIVVMPAPSVADEITALAEPLREIAREFQVHTLMIEPDGGWPRACNQHFARACALMGNMHVNEPFAWFEADLMPIVPDWRNQVVTERNTCRKPFWGHVRPSAEVMPGADGMHMVGAGFYPPNFPEMTRMWQFTPDNIPFDVWMRHYTGPHAFNSRLYAHARRTFDYRRAEDGKLTCRDEDAESHLRRVIPPEAILIHGCRDNSLVNLILEGLPPAPVAAPVEPPAPQEAELASQPPKHLSNRADQPPAPGQPAESDELSFRPVWDKMAKFIHGSKKMMAGPLAEAIQIPKEYLLRAIDYQTSPFTRNGPAAWVATKDSLFINT